ncbi:MAG: hypothetical protein ACPLRW_13465 [Moorellales bacterium]
MFSWDARLRQPQGRRSPGPLLDSRRDVRVSGLKSDGCWFGFGSPFGWWGSMSLEEEPEMLKEYRRWPEGERERVNERIRRLGGG